MKIKSLINVIITITCLCFFVTSCDKNEDGKTSFNDVSVSGTKDGHNYVDLGLSVNWSTMNLGAYNPWDNGSFYKWSRNGSFYELNICGTSQDNATYEWGGAWRTPTLWEAYELFEKCSWQVTTLNGNKGCLGTGPNGNTIFFPFAGRHWYDDNETYNVGESGEYWTSIIMPKGKNPLPDYISYLSQYYDRTTWVMLFNDEGRHNFYVDGISSDLMRTVRPVFGSIVTDDENGSGGSGGGGTSSGDAPYVTSYDYTATNTSITVKFMCSERPTSATVKYGTSSATKTASSSIAGKQVSATVSGLKAGTKYYFKCTVKNENGSSTSDEYPAMTNY